MAKVTSTKEASKSSKDDNSKVVFESSRLEEVSEGDKEFEKELIGIYKDTCEEKLPLLETALKGSNFENSVLYSHDIKGSSANIGAEKVRRISEKMEMLSRQKEYTDAFKLFGELKDALQETYKVLEEHIAK